MENKKIYCIRSQKNLLIELLKKDPELISGKFNKEFTFKDSRNRWTAIADSLNALPGCVKDWSQWKRTWQDSRTKVRGKKAMINRHLKGTGGGPQVSATLTPIETQILDLVNPVTIDGDENIPTPVTIFQFDDINDLPIELEKISENDEIGENTNCTTNEAIVTVETSSNKTKVGTSTATKRLSTSLAIGKDICDIGQ